MYTPINQEYKYAGCLLSKLYCTCVCMSVCKTLTGMACVQSLVDVY